MIRGHEDWALLSNYENYRHGSLIFALDRLRMLCRLRKALFSPSGRRHRDGAGLKHGDRIFISRNLGRIERGEIVIFYYPFDESKSYIKRVVGLPNDRVEIREGQVFVNAEEVREPYVDSKNNQAQRSSTEITVPGNSYYVLGDNRYNSNDSRTWGPLQRNFIYGKFASK